MKHDKTLENEPQENWVGAAGIFIFFASIFCSRWFLSLCILFLSSGCMQLTGIKKMDAWGLVVESNSGFEVLAGAKQYEFIDDRKGMNLDRQPIKGVTLDKKATKGAE